MIDVGCKDADHIDQRPAMSLDIQSSGRSAALLTSKGRGAAGQRARHQEVIVGDCLQVMSGMAESSVDVVVTSPPYNIGVDYKSYSDTLPRATYLDWLRTVSKALHRLMRPDASLFLNVGATNTDPWLDTDVAACFRDDFVLQNKIIWVKSISVGDDTVGHFKPITSGRFLNNNHESIFHFTKTGARQIDRLAVGVPFKDKTNIARWGHARDRRCAGNTWFIPYETVRSKAQKFDHPAGFPVGLPERCIKLHGQTDAVVFDPFVGAGSTVVAARNLGMNAIGIEIDPDYAAIAQQRLEGG
jgi:site-specific DNA-methyltransferase (adenine-specific)